MLSWQGQNLALGTYTLSPFCATPLGVRGTPLQMPLWSGQQAKLQHQLHACYNMSTCSLDTLRALAVRTVLST